MAFMLYLAGGYASEVETQLLDMGVNRLYSQLNDRKLGERWLEYNKNVAPRNILVDSGAYSAHTKGKVVDVDDYIAYVNANQGAFQGIAQLDTIPGKLGVPKTLQELAEAPEQSWQNYLYMRQHVKDVECLIPVFHQGEDFKHLNRLLEWTDGKGNHIPYIGISPANDVALKFRDSWMSVVFHHIKKSSNPNVKTHGFGVTSFNILQKYPLYSADSTSWIMASANGGVITQWGVITVSDNQIDNQKHVSHLPADRQELLEQQLMKFGVTLEQCRVDYKARGIYNARYLMDWAKNYKFKGNNTYQKKLF